ncbi:MAG: alpha/beta fold hydrolase [Gammaproteobacteria bacterium]|nr:alpha/beta fold hydrolase [Gammaproteobacteria bacterium]
MLIDVPGPAGVLEAQLSEPPSTGGQYAVLCHPHPQFGGTMHDTVLDILAGALERRGVACLRFNFRGVGASAGEHDGAGGEVDDVLAAVALLQAEYEPTALTLGGYSFGASMVWQALDKLDTPERVLLVAPPVGVMEFNARELDCPVEVFVGDQDQYVEQRALDEWRGVRAHVIGGADHFFSGRWEALDAALNAALV